MYDDFAAISPWLYPNSVNDWLFVSWNAADFSEQLEVQLIDLYGRSYPLIMIPTASGLQIALGDWPAGLYFFQ